jgi:hypothetical protein
MATFTTIAEFGLLALGVALGLFFARVLSPRRSLLVLMAFPLPAFLLFPGQTYLTGLCYFEAGIHVDQPVAGIDGWAIEPRTNAVCGKLCRSLLGHYSFVEAEELSKPRADRVGEVPSHFYRFTLQKKGWKNPRRCIDRPDKDGWCVASQEIPALSAPYMITSEQPGSRYLRIVGEVDKVVDRKTGDILASVGSFERLPPSGFNLDLSPFFGLPQHCPESKSGTTPFLEMLESFPPPKRTGAKRAS